MKAEQHSTGNDMTSEPMIIKHDDLDFFDADWGQLTWYASEKQGNTDYLTLGRCIIYPNQQNPRHYHPNCEEILTVIEGKIAHTWKFGEEIEMNEGDTITIPRGMQHQARNIGDKNAVLFIAFTSADRQTVGES